VAELVTIKETVDVLRVCRNTVGKLIREGRLTSVAIGRRRFVRADSVRALIRPESVN